MFVCEVGVITNVVMLLRLEAYYNIIGALASIKLWVQVVVITGEGVQGRGNSF
jgi:hypothetical protein